MKKILKNSMILSLGLIVGLTASSFGALEKITVFKDNVTKIYVQGSELKSKDLLNYKGTLYLPVRAISENMGMNVVYDSSRKTVQISERPLTKEEEIAKNAKIYEEALAEAKKLQAKDQEQARKEEVGVEKVQHRELPISFRQDKFVMTLNMVVRENARTYSEFYFEVKNENPYGMVVDPFSAKFNYTGEHRDFELSSNNISSANMDKKILSSLDQDYKDTVYLTLESIPKDVKEGTLTFNVRKVGEDTFTKVIMPIKF